MNNRELKYIIEQIEEKEALGLNAIAAKARVNRSHLSTLKNMEITKEISDRLVAKIKKQFPGYFEAKPTNQQNQQPITDTSYVDKYISEKEARRQEAEETAKFLKEQLAAAQAEKDKLFAALAKAQDVLISNTERLNANLTLGIHQLQEQIYVTSTSVVRTEEAVQKMNLSADPKHVAPFAKKDKAVSGPQQDGGKKDKAH